MATFLTVNEAAKRTGKSPSSIRRILYPILKQDDHPDRRHIEPDVETARDLRLRGENFAWRISEELLARVAPEGSSKPKSEAKSEAGDSRDAALVDILRKQLDIKDQQIANQNDVIRGLSERVREGNILMGKLQERLGLSDGSNRKSAEVVNAKPVDREERSDDVTDKPKKKHWLFTKIF